MVRPGMGSLATYGFIMAYALVCLALPRYLAEGGALPSIRTCVPSGESALRPNTQVISWLAYGAMILVLVGNLYPVQEGAYGTLPYI